jgi:hypothetical protein
MDCLTSLIGLDGCTTSTAVLTVNSLPGMSLRSIDSIADEEQINYEGVWSDVKTFAKKKFNIDFTHHLGKRYQLEKIQNTFNLGKVIDTSTTRAGAAEYRGVLIDLDYPLTLSTDYKKSSFQSLWIEKINFYSPAIKAGNVFKIYDYDTNTLIDSVTQSVVVGWNEVAVRELYPYRRIAVVTDCTTFTTITHELPDNLDCCLKFDGVYWSTAANISTLTKGENTHGMSIICGVHCDFETLVCNNTDKFLVPYWYLCGSILCTYRKFSKRTNKWTMAEKEADELKAFYDVEYEKSLKQVCDSIHIDINDSCIECDGMYNLKESI